MIVKMKKGFFWVMAILAGCGCLAFITISYATGRAYWLGVEDIPWPLAVIAWLVALPAGVWSFYRLVRFLKRKTESLDSRFWPLASSLFGFLITLNSYWGIKNEPSSLVRARLEGELILGAGLIVMGIILLPKKTILSFLEILKKFLL